MSDNEQEMSNVAQQAAMSVVPTAKSSKKAASQQQQKKPPALPPMMMRRDVAICNIFLGVTCAMLGPGLIVVNSMLASAAAAIAPHGEALFGSISGIFLIIGVIFVVCPIYFFFFSNRLFRFIKNDSSSTPDAVVTSSNEPVEEEQQQQNEEGSSKTSTDSSGEDSACIKVCAWILRMLLIIVIIITIVAGILGVIVHSMKVNVPPLNQDYSSVKGPSGSPITLQRDENGFPHIFAKTRRDGLFGLGFVQAQDRLFQLEAIRLIGSGKLSKYAGKSAVKIDKLMRTLRISEAAKKLCDGLSSQRRSDLTDFADGINAYLKTEFARPAEFLFIGQLLEYHEPAPFSYEDVCLFTKLLQFQLGSSQFSIERRRTKSFFSTDFPSPANYSNFEAYFYDIEDTAADTTPFTDADLGITVGDSLYNTVLQDEEDSFALEKRLYDEVIFPKYRTSNSIGNTRPDSRSSRRAQQAQQHEQQQQQQQQHKQPFFLNADTVLKNLLGDHTSFTAASNAWASREGGKGYAIHASDPHLANNLPSAWYFYHTYIQDEDFHVSGATAPGQPIILNGRTSTVRFGNTLSITDQGDLFFMVADPARPDTHYMHNGVSKPYTVYTETIEVYGGTSETFTVRVAPEYGPDVADVYDLLPTSGSSKTASDNTPIRICAYLTPLQVENDTAIDAFFGMNSNETRNISQLVAQAQKLTSPGLSMVLSDEFGGIGTMVTSQHRTRAKGHTGRIPTLGNGTFDYLDIVPVSENPQKADSYTASSNFVWAANSRPHPRGWNHSNAFGYDFVQWRARMINDHLWQANQSASGQANLSSVSFHQKMQQNQSSGFWFFTIINDLQLTNSSSTNGAAFESALSSAGLTRWNQLKNSWDGVARMGSTETSDLWAWIFTSVSEFDPLFKNDYHMQGGYYILPYFIGMIHRPVPFQKTLCAAKVAGGSISDATVCTKYLAQTFSTFVESSPYRGSKWAHPDSKIFFSYQVKHLILHGSIVEALFSREAIKGGDQTSIDVLEFEKSDSAGNPKNVPFVGEKGPSARWVFQNANASNNFVGSWINFPAGNSGNIFSKFYFNFVNDYENGVYRPLRHVTSTLGGDDVEKMTQVLGEN